MKQKDEIHYLLINPPLTDPTAPYHSISYLVGAASNAGYTNFFCLDANIESLNYLTQRERIEATLRYCETVRVELEKKNQLTRGEQLLYRYAVKSVGLKPQSVLRAVEIMRDSRKFYEYGVYRQAVMVLNRWIDTLSVQGFPAQFDNFALNLYVANFSSIDDLTNTPFLNRLMNPFSPYFNGPFTETILNRNWDLVGLSVNYISQLPFAIFLSKLIRSLCPKCIICAGGTEITDCVKYMSNRKLVWNLFSDCDALVVGEGETALTTLLNSISLNEQLPKQCPGVLVRDDPIILDDFKLSLHMKYENLSVLPEPRYDIWDWNNYWAPEPVVLYSPTRGCYWDKCTFCDYGLNTDSPTSPSRQRPIEIAIREIQNIMRFSRTLYLAVDVISPAYLRRFAQAMVENGLSIRLGAELRLESKFQTGLAEELKKAGFVCISFGYESGSQRVLDLIDKGIKLQDVSSILRELSRVGIGSQMMGFIGFPSETPDEAFATFEFLVRNKSYWTLAAIGDFVLTPGAIVAKRYEDFGIEKISGCEGDDIIRAVYWIWDGKIRVPGDIRSTSIERISESIRLLADDRPFVGGIDSSHTILYFAKYGPSLVPSYLIDSQASESIIETAYNRTPFRKPDEFLNKDHLENYHRQQRTQGRSVNFDNIMKWLAEYPNEQEIRNRGNEVIEIHPSGHYTSLTQEEIEYQESASYRTLKDLLLRGKGVS